MTYIAEISAGDFNLLYVCNTYALKEDIHNATYSIKLGLC